MTLFKPALAGLLMAASLLSANAMAADTSTKKDDKGIHAEIRDGAKETPQGNKGTGTGILGTGPVKEQAEDVKSGKSEKMNDNQYETNNTKKKGEDADR